MFLIRTTFWLGLLLFILPIDTNQNDAAEHSSISTFQALGAAQSVISDFSRFCTRNAAACETGGAALEHVGHKARASAKLVYEYLDGNLADPETTASIPGQMNTETGVATDTLSNSDRSIPWRVPAEKPSV